MELARGRLDDRTGINATAEHAISRPEESKHASGSVQGSDHVFIRRTKGVTRKR